MLTFVSYCNDRKIFFSSKIIREISKRKFQSGINQQDDDRKTCRQCISHTGEYGCGNNRTDDKTLDGRTRTSSMIDRQEMRINLNEREEVDRESSVDDRLV